MSQSKKKWAVFISGNGSNLQALIDAQPSIPIEVVVSSRAEAFGLQRAVKAAIPTKVLSKEIDWEELHGFLKSKGVDYIFLAGFMRLVPPTFVDRWEGRMVNLHPSLLPAFKGLKAIERSYQEGAAMGVTVHWVTADLDAGPLILQRGLLEAGEAKAFTLEEVAQKIHQLENEMVVEAVRRIQSC